MKTLKFKPFLLFIGLSFALISCGEKAAEDSDGSGETEEAVQTTEEFIAEANEIGKEEFEKKYPMDSEVTLQGEVRAPATWSDKIAVKFGSGLNDLPLTANFMFTDNGGSKEAAKEKIKGGENVKFKGKITGYFFGADGKLSRCTFDNCVTL